jgi:hypothetical protein
MNGSTTYLRTLNGRLPGHAHNTLQRHLAAICTVQLNEAESGDGS